MACSAFEQHSQREEAALDITAAAVPVRRLFYHGFPCAVFDAFVRGWSHHHKPNTTNNCNREPVECRHGKPSLTRKPSTLLSNFVRASCAIERASTLSMTAYAFLILGFGGTSEFSKKNQSGPVVWGTKWHKYRRRSSKT